MKRSLSIILAALLVYGCAAPATKQAATPKPLPKTPPLVAEPPPVPVRGEIPAAATQVKVALLLPLSGDSTQIGTAMLDAATLALYDCYLSVPTDQIHAQLVLMPKDTGNTPADSAKAAQQAVDQGASFFIGPLFSQSVSAVAPILDKKNINMITFSNNREVASSKIFTFGFLPEQQVERIAEYAYLNKLTRVAVLAPNDNYGEKVRDSLAEIYLRKGGLVSATEMYAPSASNIEAAVTRLATGYSNIPEERRFQAIFIADSGYQLKNLLTSLKNSAIDLKKVKIIGAGLWEDIEATQSSNMQGAWFPSSPPEAYERFEKHFMAAYGYKPPRLASLAYDAVTVAAQAAMSGADNLNAATLTDPRGFMTPANGLMRFTAGGLSDRKLAVMEVTAQGFKVIDPAQTSFPEKPFVKHEDAATQKPQKQPN